MTIKIDPAILSIAAVFLAGYIKTKQQPNPEPIYCGLMVPSISTPPEEELVGSSHFLSSHYNSN